MNYPYTAQCPSCKTDLDISQADMEKGSGYVVCGNCNNQFYAPDHLLKGFFAPRVKPNTSTVAEDQELNSENEMTAMNTDEIMLPSSAKYLEYRRKRFLRKTGLLVANLGLITFLLFQLLWINFDRWVAKENFRPIYSFLCSIENLNCQLPAWVEPGRLVLQDFQVDLRDDSVYVIQAKLVNKDNRPQPFPWVDVIFSDINGIVIASGRFSPYQYLTPQETDNLMAVAGNYDILLEVRKPDYPVVSYEMHLVAVAP